jgi:hypothetical protein
MTITAYLGGEAMPSYQGEGRIYLDDEGVGIRYSTNIPKGVHAHILIDENSFERLALCMMALNSEAAMNAFGAALQVGRAQARKMFGY